MPDCGKGQGARGGGTRRSGPPKRLPLALSAFSSKHALRHPNSMKLRFRGSGRGHSISRYLIARGLACRAPSFRMCPCFVAITYSKSSPSSSTCSGTRALRWCTAVAVSGPHVHVRRGAGRADSHHCFAASSGSSNPVIFKARARAPSDWTVQAGAHGFVDKSGGGGGVVWL